jgi:hypothetical protein
MGNKMKMCMASETTPTAPTKKYQQGGYLPSEDLHDYEKMSVAGSVYGDNESVDQYDVTPPNGNPRLRKSMSWKDTGIIKPLSKEETI